MTQDNQDNGGKLIDYREVVARFSFSEHARRADEYFSGHDAKSTIARKPFSALEETGELCAAISAMLAGLNLFSGARVLEFGAGTCWFSRILALLRCEVVAVDVSGKALDIGRQLIQADMLASELRVEFVRLEDPELPFSDASFDRVLCFDALHHVPDQGFAITEFARVLKQPGIIALHEPGPDHSKGAQSQYEMHKFDVIEADVHIGELIARARQSGISVVKMATYSARPVFTDPHDFDQFLADPSTGSVAQALTAQAYADFQNRRVCFMHKGDPGAPVDSRRRDGLLMDFEGTAELNSDHARVHGVVRNIGAAAWLPSSAPIDGSGHAGDVNIGVHLLDREGTQHNSYYVRRMLSAAPIGPGDAVQVDFTIPFPAGLNKFCFEVDLVAEHVTWFEMAGSQTFRIEVTQ